MSETELIGQVIGSQFRVLKKLGSGGMGAVYLAEQIEMERKVVVKVLHAELSAHNPIVIERFRREAKAVAQLNHPNIVQVFVFGQADNGQMYLAMEYIEGRDLGVELARGILPQPRALKILDQVCAALIEAHGAGIVHRDLKPENIMLADRHGNPDYVKVLDFGIAKLHDSGDSKPALTQQGTVFGTPRYMSPEQVRGEPVDARSDIYALGLILYEMLCGRHPFEAVTTIDYLMKHVNEPVPVPSVAFGELEIQPRIERILLKCLEKDPATRYQSVAELQREVRFALRDFSEAVRGFPSEQSTRGISTVKAAYAPPKKTATPSWVWVLVGLVLVGGVIGLVLALSPSQPRDVAHQGVGPVLLGDDPDEPDDRDDPADPADPALAGTKPDGEPDKEPDAPDDTTVKAGDSIDGFPLPNDARSVTSSPQMEMYETAYTPRDVVAFYRVQLRGRYTLEEVPNGLMVKSDKSPFSFITLQNNGDRYYLILQRNALAPVTKPAGPLPAAYGVEFPADATLIMRSEQAVVARSRMTFAAVCDFYDTKYGKLEGVIAMRDLEASQPYCTIAATSEGIAWTAIAIIDDPMSKGAVMITVAKRM